MKSVQQTKPRRLVRFGKWLAAIIVACGLLFIVGMFFAPQLLRVESETKHADAIVVLGGENWKRVPRAAELFLAGRAPLIVVSGRGDCEDNRQRLVKAGVPKSALLSECESTSTFENAEFTVALLRQKGATNVIIVTSWYHSRRAMACFRKADPTLTFFSVTTEPNPKHTWPDGYERKMITMEYLKSAGYIFKHGVWPW